ncbi:MAG: hypothetical protein ACKN9V_11010, partial [Pseudomonadota bacterium]
MVSKRVLSFLLVSVVASSIGLATGERHRDGVGEVDPIKRKKAFGSDRGPAILNLNDELEALSELNVKPQELFFNKFLVVDDKILLFGEKLTGVLTCSGKTGPSLVVSESRQINTHSIKMPPGSRALGFKDGELC